jgi:hypothetical protein
MRCRSNRSGRRIALDLGLELTLLGRTEKVGFGAGKQVGRRLCRLEFRLGTVRSGSLVLLVSSVVHPGVLGRLLSKLEVGAWEDDSTRSIRIEMSIPQVDPTDSKQ